MVRDWPDDALLRLSRAKRLLAQGDYVEGFRLHRAWSDVPELRARIDLDYPFPRWSGEDVAGKRVLVVSMDGLGDQIMYARFARLLARRGAEVHWLCAPPLARLFQRCLGVTAIPMAGTVNLRGYDYFCPLPDLAPPFFPPLTAPPRAPYLTHPPATALPGLTVGVMTHGNPAHREDGSRSLPSAFRAELLNIPGAVDLKPEITGARDFYDTAQIVAGLDLVISVDTSVAHLAGAMGKPVWILLSAANSDWRWMSHPTESAWYPSARLFRQTYPGDWQPVITAVRGALVSGQVNSRSTALPE